MGGNVQNKWVTLAPSLISPFVLSIAYHTTGGAIAGDDSRTPLELNTYEANVTVLYAGTDSTRASRCFVVAVDGLAWIDD
jgi:hypothetical protein